VLGRVVKVDSEDNSIFIESLTPRPGKVVKVNGDDNSIVVESPNPRPHKYVIDGHTKKRANKKTELAGKRNISLADYRPGQIVKLTCHIPDDKVIEIRLTQN
jgi:ribosomal protein L24